MLAVVFDMMVGATVAIGLFSWAAAILRTIVVALKE